VVEGPQSMSMQEKVCSSKGSARMGYGKGPGGVYNAIRN